MHPSLKAYIDSFMSAPFPKAYPRGGGVWDQDPILMRDFRIIRKFELEWKEAQSVTGAPTSGATGGGIAGIGDALNQYIDQYEEQMTY